LGEF
jgi:hypothetical protein